ncbi:MAG TPA: riboflavin kinase, partial [Alphaproteobacteria bacterium]|nr:riboflavin kinase [Alphaproteobacteria bacterium]
IHPAYGIYAAWVQVVGEDGTLSPWHMSATNIGIRPMFKVPTGQVEAHILDFNEDVYDRTLRVRPVRLLRGEARFETLKALVAQIERDCAAAKDILKNTAPSAAKGGAKQIKNGGFFEPEG